MSDTLTRTITWLLSAVLLGLSIFFGVLLSQTWREYQHIQTLEQDAIAELDQLREEYARKDTYLMRLLDEQDPEFLEQVVRERLGYLRPGEVRFRIEDGG